MTERFGQPTLWELEDAVNGRPDAVVRESADLLYNLMVVWVAAGVKPEDVWAEMDHRENLLGIAEKMPKTAQKTPHKVPVVAPILHKSTAAARPRRTPVDAQMPRARKRS